MSESRAEEYSRKARECRSQAGATADYEHKASWLKLAAKWQRMAEEAGPVAAVPAQRKAEG
jgi:hypothetical protein